MSAARSILNHATFLASTLFVFVFVFVLVLVLVLVFVLAHRRWR